jgi:hypothetical protein
MGVDLCAVQGSYAQKLFDPFQLHAALQQVRRNAVPQRMGADAFGQPATLTSRLIRTYRLCLSNGLPEPAPIKSRSVGPCTSCGRPSSM